MFSKVSKTLVSLLVHQGLIIMSQFQKYINYSATIQFSIKHSKCQRHKSRDKPCEFNVYSTGKKTKIYGAYTNYTIPELYWYCKEYKCRKYNLLYTRNLITNPKDFIYIITENKIKQRILCIGRSFIAEDILLYVNNLTIDDINGKAVAKWRKNIKINFVTTSQKGLKSDDKAYDKIHLTKYINKQIISKHYLEWIMDFLWHSNWLPFVGMIYYTLLNIIKHFYTLLYIIIYIKHY